MSKRTTMLATPTRALHPSCHHALAKLVAQKLYAEPRLQGVPVPVIDEVLNLAWLTLSMHLPDCIEETPLPEIFDEEWCACEGCDEWIAPGAIAMTADEGCSFCGDCYVKPTEEEAP